MDCEGKPGHPGPHGWGDDRWSDAQAEQAAMEREAWGKDVPDGPAWRGVVYTHDAQSWRGVLQLTAWGVHVELVGDAPGPFLPSQGHKALTERGVQSVVLPWSMVLRIEVAREPADRPTT